MVIKSPNPRILVTVPHGCSTKPRYSWMCDDNSIEIGQKIVEQLKQRGYNKVRFIYTDAFRGFVDANGSETKLKNLPSGKELQSRLKEANKRIEELKSLNIVAKDTKKFTPRDIFNELNKAIKFREKVSEVAKNRDIHIDVHSFGGCQTGIKTFDCKDIAVLDISFYARDNKMTRELVNALEDTNFSVGKYHGSHANNVIVSSRVANSALVEFNRDTIEKRAREKADEWRKNRQTKKGSTDDPLEATIQEITNEFVPALDAAIKKIVKE